MRVLMTPAPNSNNLEFSCACRWHRCCCLYRTETSVCPRFMGTVGQDASYPIDMDVGCRTLSAMGVEKLIADLCVERRKERAMPLSWHAQAQGRNFRTLFRIRVAVPYRNLDFSGTLNGL
jgi:hypothetical protein